MPRIHTNEEKEAEEEKLLEHEGSRSRALVKGALRLLQLRSGSEFYGAILAGFLISIGFVGLALLSMILALGQHYNGTCCQNRTFMGYDKTKSTNVYFLKYENRSWTNEEFCAIEAAAHYYPHYNIFVINLLSNDIFDGANEYSKYFDEILEDFISSKKKKIIKLQNRNSSETKLRYELSKIPNVNNIDISVDRFFARSIISKEIKMLSSHEIELAAKFQVIWDSSGIALEPLIILQLESVGRFMNKNKIDIVASIQLDNDLQGASVPCQSFIGFVISQMAKGAFTDRQSLLKHALMDFCPRSVDCLGVRIVKPISKGFPKSCPMTYTFVNKFQL